MAKLHLACAAVSAIASIGVLASPRLAAQPLGAAPCLDSQGGYELSFENDVFGPGPVSEWDDLYSYGFGLALPLGKSLSLSATYDGLTDRGEGSSGASRIDRLDTRLSYAMPLVSPAYVDLSLSASLGFWALGDFGAIGVQDGWHTGSGIYREVPTSYDQGSEARALGGAELSASIPTLGPLAPFAQLGADYLPPGTFSGIFDLGLGYRSEGSSIDVAVGWSLGACDASSKTMRAVFESERGLFVEMEARVGYLALSLDALPANGVSSGSIGLVLDPPRGRRAGAGARRRMSLSFGLGLGSAPAPFYRLDCLILGLDSPLGLGAFASVGNGWMTREASGPAAPRFSEYAVGLSARGRAPGGRLSGGLGLGGRLAFEGLYALSLERSEPLGGRVLAAADIDGDVRIVLTPDRASPSGVGLRTRWSPFCYLCSAAGEDFEGRPPLDLQIFVFSEG